MRTFSFNYILKVKLLYRVGRKMNCVIFKLAFTTLLLTDFSSKGKNKKTV